MLLSLISCRTLLRRSTTEGFLAAEGGETVASSGGAQGRLSMHALENAGFERVLSKEMGDPTVVAKRRSSLPAKGPSMELMQPHDTETDFQAPGPPPGRILQRQASMGNLKETLVHGAVTASKMIVPVLPKGSSEATVKYLRRDDSFLNMRSKERAWKSKATGASNRRSSLMGATVFAKDKDGKFAKEFDNL